MRFLAIAALAAALLAPAMAGAQDALDAAPMTWHGLQLGPEQVFEGTFTNDSQTSTFRPDGAAADVLWLSGWEDRPGDGGSIVRRYHLRFVGRETVAPGKYGPMGGYRNEVLLTHLISARLLITEPEKEAPATPAKTTAKPRPKPRPKHPVKRT